ncbi:hypothetical protein ACOMHN_056597 [Nucella lapillus]
MEAAVRWAESGSGPQDASSQPMEATSAAAAVVPVLDRLVSELSELKIELFDKDQKGYITQEELEIILCNAFTMDGDQAAELFYQADTNKDGKITYEDFKAYAEEKPEYASLFVTYHEMSSQSPSSTSSPQSTPPNMVSIDVGPARPASRRVGPSGQAESSSERDAGQTSGKLKSQ